MTGYPVNAFCSIVCKSAKMHEKSHRVRVQLPPRSSSADQIPPQPFGLAPDTERMLVLSHRPDCCLLLFPGGWRLCVYRHAGGAVAHWLHLRSEQQRQVMVGVC